MLNTFVGIVLANAGSSIYLGSVLSLLWVATVESCLDIDYLSVSLISLISFYFVDYFIEDLVSISSFIFVLVVWTVSVFYSIILGFVIYPVGIGVG